MPLPSFLLAGNFANEHFLAGKVSQGHSVKGYTGSIFQRDRPQCPPTRLCIAVPGAVRPSKVAELGGFRLTTPGKKDTILHILQSGGISLGFGAASELLPSGRRIPLNGRGATSKTGPIFLGDCQG